MNRSALSLSIVSFIARIIIGTIFLMSGLAKIADPINFYSTLDKFKLFPDFFERFIAIYIPWLEFFLGTFLIIGIFHRAGALVITLLNIIFSVAIISLIYRGIVVDCGCFGVLADIFEFEDLADYRGVIRNSVFFLLSLLIFYSKESIITLENYFKK